MRNIHDIYDRACKRCLSLSQKSTILLINGLYDKDYPPDSAVTYHWTEHEDQDLNRTLADTIITINHLDSYHIEIQMYPDQEIVMRVFEYGYHHAVTNRQGKDILLFPSPKILYLYEDGNAPDYHELTIYFGDQGQFEYRVPTFSYLKMNLDELNRRKLIVLIPFQLLRLRKAIEKERAPENLEQLKYLIQHDIIGTIKENMAAGNITAIEGQKLQRITLQLYRHIYEKYDELEKAGVNQMAEEALILDVDIVEQQLTRKLTKELTEKLTAELTRDLTAELTRDLTAELTRDLTAELTRDLTAKLTEKLTDKITDEVTRKFITRLQSRGLPEEEILSLTGLTDQELKKILG